MPPTALMSLRYATTMPRPPGRQKPLREERQLERLGASSSAAPQHMDQMMGRNTACPATGAATMSSTKPLRMIMSASQMKTRLELGAVAMASTPAMMPPARENLTFGSRTYALPSTMADSPS